MKQMIKRFAWIALLPALFLPTGCGGGGGGQDTGTLKLALTDNTAPVYSSVVISIKEVRAVPAGQEAAADSALPLIASFDQPKQVEVLSLAYVQEALGEAVLPAGTYHQIRLILAENSDPNDPANYVVLQGGTGEHLAIKAPSAQTSGLKLNTPGTFEVKAGEVNTVVLDFDPAKAIVDSGNALNFKPTGIRIIQMVDDLVDFGALAGTVAPQEALASAVVSAINADGITVASGQVNAEDGSFRIFLPAGSYQLKVAATGFTPFSSDPAAFEVVGTADTDAGTITLTPAPAATPRLSRPARLEKKEAVPAWGSLFFYSSLLLGICPHLAASVPPHSRERPGGGMGAREHRPV